ncbi:iron-containing alcohol dehydrogenase [Nitratidesulfovibrio vulgaris]|uniref:Alcohol dehydrogenase, iron-containing n=1 Tax=Nitratidesulfovibrio vulgaris (strain ATCC 29579 / DSM 644 / CCUG 34227 / NCIMB 8303 / VKM B-1760 / Hildenborough) TaxID=882 RepID=Q727H0_NITV2|nr:iron-containing alcohol dehydrogenase [Nitratidesulfovibrio vulgaris]AAS97357.1 alcohol dehydrogenase, iron-containing [Nitratidesulfovibrio vulgaris str. Hildenborough]ADP87807.1 iron-containing alcohol dehydrogenase [Nitratidesulfovibrio vulgaris RCH1]
MLDFTFHVPTRIVFGAGRLEELGRLPLPGVKPLVVVGAGGSMRRHGHLDRVLALLRQNGCEPMLFERVRPNPSLVHVDEGACVARANGCDFIVGLGGGSPIDAAKAIALAAANGGSYWDYIQSGTGGRRTPQHPALPVVAIPTTAGTGTEADPWTVVTRDETQEKIGWGNDSTYPVLSIVDPALTITVPPRITAMTGMDAFFHAVEAYLSLSRQPSSDLLALEAVSLLAQFLPQAVRQGDSVEVRSMVSWASTAAGLCESLSSCIAHHSMEHALSAYHPDLPHGAGLVMLSLPFFEVMARVQPKRCADLAATMGMPLHGLPPAQQGMAFVEGLRLLIRAVGLDDLRLADHGITAAEIPALAKNARETMGALFPLTPVDLRPEDVEAIFAKALAGPTA